jgi:hypothetical protein
MDWNVVGEITKNLIVAALLAGNIGALGYLSVELSSTTD